MKTLDKILDIIALNLKVHLPITLVSKKGIKLAFARLYGTSIIHITCEKPGKKVIDKFLNPDETGRWKQDLSSDFKLKLNATCWTTHKDTLDAIDERIGVLHSLKDTWAALNKEDKTDSDAQTANQVCE